MKWWQKDSRPPDKLEKVYDGPLPSFGEANDPTIVYTVTEVTYPDQITQSYRLRSYSDLSRHVHRQARLEKRPAPWAVPEDGERCMTCGVYLPQTERGPKVIELMIASERSIAEAIRLEDVVERSFCSWIHLENMVLAARSSNHLHAMCAITPPGAIFRQP